MGSFRVQLRRCMAILEFVFWKIVFNSGLGARIHEEEALENEAIVKIY